MKPHPINRAIELLQRIQFDEAQEVLNDLRQIKYASMNATGIQRIKLELLKQASKHASAAYTAVENLDAAEEILAFVAVINKEIAETQIDE